MKLYYAAGACSLASHIMLYEVGETFMIERVDTEAGVTETGRPYREINRNGYVPTLEINGDEYLSEGVAILQYIADNHPQRAFSPRPGSLERGRLQQYLNFAAAELHKSWGPLFAATSSEQEQLAARKRVADKFEHLESVLSDGRDFLVADQFSVADAYTFVLVNWANIKNIDLSVWPHLDAYVQRIMTRPSTQAAMQAEGLI